MILVILWTLWFLRILWFYRFLWILRIWTKIDLSLQSFDDSREDILDHGLRNQGQVYKRRSSNQRQSRSRARRSHSMVGDKIVTTTTVTVDQNGHTHAKAILESQAATFGELQEKVKFIPGVATSFRHFSVKSRNVSNGVFTFFLEVLMILPRLFDDFLTIFL